MDEKFKLQYPRTAYTVADYYVSYKLYTEPNTIYDIPYETFLSIVKDYFKYLTNEIIEEGKEVKLPCRLGSLLIIKRLPKFYNKKSLRIDYHESKIQGIVVYHLNEHSNYFKYRLHWRKIESAVINKSKYLFVLTRDNKRRLAQIIKNRERDFLEV